MDAYIDIYINTYIPDGEGDDGGWSDVAPAVELRSKTDDYSRGMHQIFFFSSVDAAVWLRDRVQYIYLPTNRAPPPFFLRSFAPPLPLPFSFFLSLVLFSLSYLTSLFICLDAVRSGMRRAERRERPDLICPISYYYYLFFLFVF